MTLPEHVARFPWPFTGDSYRYSANLEAAPRQRRTAAGAWGASLVDVGPGYADELGQRAAVLAADPRRHGELAHMRPATWDALLLLLASAAADRPQHLVLAREGRRWRWVNRLLGVEQVFVPGDDATLPAAPLRYAASQVQEDLVLLDQREDQLWVDAGLVTFASNWSIDFDLGMSFTEVHGPVPRDLADGVVPRAEAFLLRLQPGEAYRRLNWSSTLGHRLDTSLESAADREPDPLPGAAELPDVLHLRVESQHVVRLAPSGAVLFSIRTHLLPLRDVARVPAWAAQLAAVLEELPAEMADYKGLTGVREDAVAWLRR